MTSLTGSPGDDFIYNIHSCLSDPTLQPCLLDLSMRIQANFFSRLEFPFLGTLHAALLPSYMMKRRKHKTSICPSFGRDETVTSDSLSPQSSLDIVMEAPANQPRRHVHSAWLSSRSMVRYPQLLHSHPLQDEHLFYHDGLPSYGNGDNCL